MKRPGYIMRVLLGLDEFANTILDGFPAETISARCFRLAVEQEVYWPMELINWIMRNPSHCFDAFFECAEHNYSPEEER